MIRKALEFVILIGVIPLALIALVLIAPAYLYARWVGFYEWAVTGKHGK